ncbi:MAG: glycosyltransferase family 39 protein [Elusimicrobia bacterium]|nr:glycosyltransferase family 39 protein [Elusimicrobiota bacterium]
MTGAVALRRVREICRRYPGTTLFLAAFILRALAALALGSANDDDGTYIWLAKNILAQGDFFFIDNDVLFRSWLPPGFAYFLAGSFWLFGETLEPARWFFIVCGACSCVWLYSIGKHLFKSEPWGLLAGWTMAVYPYSIFWSSRVGVRTLGGIFFMICLWLIFQYQKNKKSYFLWLTGLAWAALSLTRAEYFLGMAAIVVYLHLTAPKKWRANAALLAALAVGMSPWIIRNWKIHHRFIPLTTYGADNLMTAFNSQYRFGGYPINPPELSGKLEGKSEIERMETIKDYVKTYIREHPARAFYIVTGNLVHFWRPFLSVNAVGAAQNFIYLAGYLPLFTFGLIGFVASLRLWKFQPFWLMLGLLVFIKWWSHAPFYMIVSFREAILPALIIFACYGVYEMNERLRAAAPDHLPMKDPCPNC